MKCMSCGSNAAPDEMFCPHCGAFALLTGGERKPRFGRRALALILDGVVSILVQLLAFVLLGTSSLAILLLTGYILFYFYLLGKGLTPGKLLLGMRVITSTKGSTPGLATMLVRDVLGKTIGLLALGVGLLSAAWERDGRGWHDRIAGTVVVQGRAS